MPERSFEELFESAAIGARNAMATRDPGQITNYAHKLHMLADRRIEAEQAVAPVKPVCKKGCDACCHRLVAATLPEVLKATAYVMNAFSEEDRKALQERLATFESEGKDYWLSRTDLSNAACPFLADHACSIYDARPLSCRALNSADADVCRRLFVDGQMVEIPHNPGQSQVSSLTMAVIAGSEDARAANGAYELGPAVKLLLEQPQQAYHLDGFQPLLERLKLISERNAEHEKMPDSVSRTINEPFAAGAWANFRLGQTEEIRRKFERRPYGPFEALLGLAMPFQYESQARLEDWWAEWNLAVERFADTDLPARETFELAELINTFTAAYAGKNVRQGMERFMSRLHRSAEKAFPTLTAPIEAPRRPGKFRLGYISPRIKNFNGSRWALGWLANNSEEIETYVINGTAQEDRVSTRFRRAADYYLHVPLAASEIGSIVRSLDLDALVFTDVGMSGKSLQLASLRLARRQFNAWGHPVTSGSPTMDGYLSSDLMEPEDAQDHYTEKLERLPGSGLCYPHARLQVPQLTHGELGVPESGFLLFCQLCFKLTPDYDHLFKEILQRSKKPVVFLGSMIEGTESALRKRLAHPNAIFLPYQPVGSYLRLLELADASLDCPPWNGGNTTIEALTLGTPVVSLAGEFMRGRHALAFLSQAGVSGLIAKDGADFVDLALNEDRRREAMLSLDVDGLYGDQAAVRALDRILLEGFPA